MTKKPVSHLPYICIFLILCMSSFQTSPALAAPEVKEGSVYVDEKPVKTSYTMENGHFLVPALFFKNTGARVDKSEKYQSIVFRLGEKQVAVPIGKNYSDVYVQQKDTWKRSPLTTKTRELSNQVYVPFLDVAKLLGMDISYDTKTSRTYVTTHSNSSAQVISKGNSNKKLVALTFDDGPDDVYTPKILDILREKDVKATFFVMGKHVDQFPKVMKRIVKEGHGIGNHTTTHPSIPDTMSSDVISEVMMTQHMIEKTVGRTPDLFRPPYGAVTKSDAQILRDMGLRIVSWSVDTEDWKGTSAEDILSNVEKNITPGGIILQHDFPATDEQLLKGSVEALPKIIDKLQAKGYQFVTVQTLLDSK